MHTLKNVHSWTSGLEVEFDAVNQIRNIASLPIVVGHVAVMPDVHVGKGTTVGTVLPTLAAIIPAAVGVDIGCGMVAVRTALKAGDLPDSLASARLAIESSIPVGFASHQKELNPTHEGPHGRDLRVRMVELFERFENLPILAVLGKIDARRIFKQLGTLGGGNHFVELCLDEVGSVWIMLHSGSRNIGKTIGEAAIGMAPESVHQEGVARRDHRYFLASATHCHCHCRFASRREAPATHVSVYQPCLISPLNFIPLCFGALLDGGVFALQPGQ